MCACLCRARGGSARDPGRRIDDDGQDPALASGVHAVPPVPGVSPPWPPGRARNAAKILAPKYQASRSRPAQKTAVEMLYRPLMREHRVAPPLGPAPGIGPSHTGDVHASWTYDHV